MQRVITYSLSDDLIENLADLLVAEYLSMEEDISRLAFVFGGKRPGLFLKRALAGRMTRGFFPPVCFSMDEYVDHVLAGSARVGRINDLEACFLMYRLVKKHTPEILKRRENFAEFLPWAREIISFIDQLDLEDVDAGSVRNIQLNAQIGYDVPADINMLLEHILLLRQEYHNRLNELGLVSRGLAYLSASRVKQKGPAGFERIFFCNLFYLHRTEERLIQNACEGGRAVLVFQGGREWPVLDALASRTGWNIGRSDVSGRGYELSIRAGFDLHSQVCVVRDILRVPGRAESSVVVLPDSNSLIPLVSEISGVCQDFNVSLGYPLKRSPVYSLFECILRSQQTRRNGQYYARDYLRTLSHPLAKNLRYVNNDPSVTRILVHTVEEVIIGMEQTDFGGSLFIDPGSVAASHDVYDLALAKMKHMDVRVSRKELEDLLAAVHELLFSSWEKTASLAGFAAALQLCLHALLEKSSIGHYPLNLKIVERIMSIAEEFADATFGSEPFAQEDLFKVFRNRLETEMVNFLGSPLKGLQILGLLETRSLNFKNVIIMDANENKLPALKIAQPLIPREIMVRLGLDQLEQEEEIQRYQFRRLISSAERVYLVYQQDNRSERSRFIEEIIWEREKAERKLDIVGVSQARFRIDMQPRRVSIRKKPHELEFLRSMTYSASGVNAYLACPLQFYYRYVLGLEEKDDLLEIPEAADIGTFIHELLETTYARFLNKRPVIDGAFEQYFFQEMDERFRRKLQRRMRSDSFLLKEVLDLRMKEFLEFERTRPVVQVLGLERAMKGNIRFGNGREFSFQARIDRIDRFADGTVAVTDYKTGDVKHLVPRRGARMDPALFERKWIRDNVKSFQLPLYLYFLDTHYGRERTNACLYNIREAGARDCLTFLLGTEDDVKNKDSVMAGYMAALGFILEEINDPERNFEPDDSDEHTCGYCPFGALCK